MKYFLFISFFFLSRICFSEDYIVEFQAKVKNLIEYNISITKKYRNYDLEGTFTDSLGNIGIFSAVINADVENGKLIKLNAVTENIYSNNEKTYSRGVREKSNVDAGIAYNTIIGTTGGLNPLIGTKCTTSVRYLNDAIFGINKCKLSQESYNLLSNIN